MSEIKIISLNVKGVGHVVKRQKIISLIKRENAQIALLQETHLSDLEHIKLRRGWVGQVFYSSFNSHSRGVAILIHKKLPFTLEEVIKDEGGRYVIISGSLFGEQILIGSIYGPNTFEPSFFSRLLGAASPRLAPFTVFGGDFNCVQDASVDQSPSKSAFISKKTARLKELSTDLGLFDVWRIMNPTTKDYTFYSHPHQSLSRIDYFLVSREVIDRVEACSIGICTLSDHNLVSMTISPPYRNPSSLHWRLNSSLLSSSPFLTFLERQWELFMATNNTPDVNPSLLWETGKAFMRGSIISYTAAYKKETIRKQLELEQAIQDSEKKFKQSPSKSNLKNLETVRSALNQLLTSKAEASILFARQRLYEHGNKPGRLLARLAKGRNNTNVISSLKDSKGDKFHESEKINNIMRQFYHKLYSTECNTSEQVRKAFLDQISLPSLTEGQQEILNRPITRKEVLESIHSLQSGKAPGPDGYGPEYYKKMSNMVVGPLTDMFLDSFRNGCLPPSLNLANISLILKKNKPPDECGSYRPVSLINVDSKILSKLLARRLENYLPSLINNDQTGFIKGRLSCSNVRRLLNVIQYSSETQHQALAISLDAEKAFDRVEWRFMWDVLGKFGLGEEFINWIKLIYHSPEACVLTNGMRSYPFPLGRGTRQGCPLSPLLFALTLEPLAERIRNSQEIHGVTLGRTTHKIALYADDVLLFLSRPDVSVPATLSIINLFGSISGYKVNYTKSEAMPLGKYGNTDLDTNFPFKWATSGFLYLGIKVSPRVEDLRKLNFAPIVRAVKSDLERWHDLPLSWIGRISLIKMNILPRLLYPMQMLPLWISKKVILDLEKAFSRYIWHNKKPRIKFKSLQLPVERGGLALPNLRFYNWACHIRIIWDWLQSHLKSEAGIDEWSSSPYSLLSKLTWGGKKRSPHIKQNPIVYNTIRVWRDLSRYFGENISSFALTPVTRNEEFAPGINSIVFDNWHRKGIRLIRDVYQDNTLMSFQQLQQKYNIASEHFFGYLQLRSFILSKVKNLHTATPAPSDIDLFILNRKYTRHFLSHACALLHSLDRLDIREVTQKWERDLGEQFIEDDWHEAIISAKTTFICNRMRETQFKILHRSHITPVILNKMDNRVSPLCIKCKRFTGTYIHCFWECHLIVRFWSNVAQELSKIFSFKITKDPGLFILSLPSKSLSLSKTNFKLCDKLLFLARRCILKQWIRDKPPTVTQ